VPIDPTNAGEVPPLLWRSVRGNGPPARWIEADDRLTADEAYRLVSQGSGILWRGDYHGARQLLQALARRIDRRRDRAGKAATADTPRTIFNAYRLAQAQRARMLSLLAVPVQDGAIPLGRAPDAHAAVAAALGDVSGTFALPLTDILAAISAAEWRRNGVAIAALDGAHIHPHFGVFPPTRQDYIDLVAETPLPPALNPAGTAFDIGTGSGVLAAVLARRIERVVATDNAPSAVACASENIARLGLADRVTVEERDLFPDGQADLIVCNPPWLPGAAATPLESAVYDPDGRMLRGFLEGLGQHLNTWGEGWLVMSDLAERLELRAPNELTGMISAAGLAVRGRSDTRPTHARTRDSADPLHFARKDEIVSVWRLGRAS
jgi:SAM-dependent methyltransferase